MKNETILSLPDMPLCIGASPSSLNPVPVPSSYPFTLMLNTELGRLEQVYDGELDTLLQGAYTLGIEMGTPSDDTELGQPYVADFVSFIEKHVPEVGRVLEIGAGTGYLSRVLLDRGWDVESVEPGFGYERYWEKHRVKVINDFFPSPLVTGPYNLIVMYTVLEHIKDTRRFLRDVVKHLAPGGKAVLSVPDCTREVEEGDVSVLLHEHYHYFTMPSLARTLAEGGLSPYVVNSEFGRSLYAVCAVSEAIVPNPALPEELEHLAAYGAKALMARKNFQMTVADLAAKGTLGIYCPARALNLLPKISGLRFFDDAPYLQGRFYPPFDAPIENRRRLLDDPTDSLIIMSRTFGARLRSQLSDMLNNTKIFLFEELL